MQNHHVFRQVCVLTISMAIPSVVATQNVIEKLEACTALGDLHLKPPWTAHLQRPEADHTVYLETFHSHEPFGSRFILPKYDLFSTRGSISAPGL